MKDKSDMDISQESRSQVLGTKKKANGVMWNSAR